MPIIIALLWSWSAPATISDAEADPPSINTTKGFPFVWSAFFALYLFISFLSLPRVETISPLSRKMSVTFTACVSKPPGLERTSKTYPIILLSGFDWIFFIASINPFSVCSLNEVILRYPTSSTISLLTDARV